jgi:hypothetical protein
MQVDLGAQSNIKVYASVSNLYSALFVVIKLGDGADGASGVPGGAPGGAPGGMQLVNIYGSFDPARLGGSMNLPTAASGAASAAAAMNPQMMQTMQMTAFKGDAAGAAYFANPEGPPPCDAYNYSVVTLSMGADGTFGIKPSGWKQGEPYAYTFKISELTPLTLQDMGNVQLWCKAPEAPPSTAAAAVAAQADAPVRVKTRDGGLVGVFVGGLLLMIVFIAIAVGTSRK